MKVKINLMIILMFILLTSCTSISMDSTRFPTEPASMVYPTDTPRVTETNQETQTSDVQKMVPETLTEYIDINYPPLPDGLIEGFGMILYPSNIGDYSISGIHNNDLHMIWFGKQTQWIVNGEKIPGWKLLDILELKTLEEDDDVLIPGGCMIDNTLDPEILVVAHLDDDAANKRFVTNEKIIQAWRANRLAGAFEETETLGIECSADMAVDW